MFDTSRNAEAIKKKVACITDRDPVRKKKDTNGGFERCYPFELGNADYEEKEHADELITRYKDNETIHVFSQDATYGKTLEYDLMRTNSASSILLTPNLANKEELEEIQSKDYPACLEKMRGSKTNERIKDALTASKWMNEEKKKALLAARYLNSVGKGANALELSSLLKENLCKEGDARIPFVIPDYIKEAIEWLLKSSSPTTTSK